MQVPTFAVFAGLVARELESEQTLDRDDALIRDCGFDSLSLFEVHALVFDTFGVDLPEDFWSSDRTLGDVYDEVIHAAVDSQLPSMKHLR